MKDITREELLNSKEYWMEDIQSKLYAEVEDFMRIHHMTRSQFAEYLGCTKGYVSQLLSGEYDSKISKLVELSLAVGKIPEISFKDVEYYFNMDELLYSGAVFTNSYQKADVKTANSRDNMGIKAA